MFHSDDDDSEPFRRVTKRDILWPILIAIAGGAMIVAALTLTGCSAATQAALDGALSHVSGSVSINPATGEVIGGIGFKDANACESTRTLANPSRRNYGRVLNPTLDNIRSGVSLTRAQEQSKAKEIKLTKQELKTTAKYDIRDLKENYKREQHNGNVALDYSSQRSMYSAFIGWFGFHRHPHPLFSSPAVEVVELPPVELPSLQTVPATNQNGLPPSGIMK